MTPSPREPIKWPMTPPEEQSEAMLLQEAARILRNCETSYTEKLAAELIRRFG